MPTSRQAVPHLYFRDECSVTSGFPSKDTLRTNVEIIYDIILCIGHPTLHMKYGWLPQHLLQNAATESGTRWKPRSQVSISHIFLLSKSIHVCLNSKIRLVFGSLHRKKHCNLLGWTSYIPSEAIIEYCNHCDAEYWQPDIHLLNFESIRICPFLLELCVLLISCLNQPLELNWKNSWIKYKFPRFPFPSLLNLLNNSMLSNITLDYTFMSIRNN